MEKCRHTSSCNVEYVVQHQDLAIDGRAWIDPEVVELAGITPEELDRYRNPAPYADEGGKVAQPELDPSLPVVGTEFVCTSLSSRGDGERNWCRCPKPNLKRPFTGRRKTNRRRR